MTVPPTVVRILTLVSGVLALVMPNVAAWGLPTAVQATITSVGGMLLAILAFLEHPVVAAKASQKAPTA